MKKFSPVTPSPPILDVSVTNNDLKQLRDDALTTVSQTGDAPPRPLEEKKQLELEEPEVSSTHDPRNVSSLKKARTPRRAATSSSSASRTQKSSPSLERSSPTSTAISVTSTSTSLSKRWAASTSFSWTLPGASRVASKTTPPSCSPTASFLSTTTP